ncbi:MarR family winged helix-turn-helix transcriptional regulator [Brevibacterium samyangense]|uniref:MarR family transcriptional regulator n=1 Tax=Brevibacterium samyangense TaxID=366888 RepID=A0ABN2TKB7_9MICO
MTSSSAGSEATEPGAGARRLGGLSLGAPGPPDAPGRSGHPGLLAETAVLDAWRAYFETGQRLTTRIEEELKKQAGLTLSDFNLLLLLVEAPERRLRMNVLAQRLVFSAPRLTYRVQVLEDRGWVVKRPCPDDGRAHHVELTDDGLRVYLRAGSVQRGLIARFFEQALGPGDAEALHRISTALASGLDEE